MIISQAQVQMTSDHQYKQERQVSEKLDFWLQQQPTPTDPIHHTSETRKGKWLEQVTISDKGYSLLHAHKAQLETNSSMDKRTQLRLMILQAFFKNITGMDLKFANDLASDEANPTEASTPDSATPSTTTPVPKASEPQVQRATPVAQPAYVYQHTERITEQESLDFNAQGTIKTQDGRTINFTTNLNMSRSFVEENNIEIRGGAAAKKIDPLVINFDGLGASLSDTRFDFDLDNNGQTEQIANLNYGSGYLALDRNGDGIINNGSELFGPATGNGFAELANFDEDNNHFIDEGDSIYNKLRIWQRNDDGSSQLIALGDKHIGAIFLGSTNSPFQLKGEKNASLGNVTQTGIYLTEEGTTGIIQQIDLNA